MKHLFSLLMVLWICSLFYACQQKSNEVVITGQLQGVEDGAVVRLMKPDGRISVLQQADTLEYGAFQFSYIDSLDFPKRMNISVDGEGYPPASLELWVVPGAEVKISGKDKLICSWDVKSHVPEQEELNRYRVKINEYERQSQIIMRDAYACFDEGQQFPEKWAELRKKIDSLYIINDSLNLLVAETEIDMLIKNKSYSPVWTGKLADNAASLKYTKLPDDYVEKLKKMYEEMPEDLKSNEDGETVFVNLYPPAVVHEGDEMADADMWDTEGNLHRLADYKGKYLLLDFWSAGCGPCIRAIPEMKEIIEMYEDRLVLISISSDPKDVWLQISKEKEITWVNLNDFKGENGIKMRYGIRGIPHYVMVSPEGTIKTTWSGYGEGSLKQKVKEVIPG